MTSSAEITQKCLEKFVLLLLGEIQKGGMATQRLVNASESNMVFAELWV